MAWDDNGWAATISDPTHEAAWDGAWAGSATAVSTRAESEAAGVDSREGSGVRVPHSVGYVRDGPFCLGEQLMGGVELNRLSIELQLQRVFSSDAAIVNQFGSNMTYAVYVGFVW